MSQERSEAVVLRGVDFSETSRIVTFLTPGRGRMACLARGARRKNSPMGAALDTFNRVELVYYWKDGRGVQNLGEVSLMADYRALKADLEKHAFAAFPLELAYKIAHENEPSDALYRALTAGLGGLDAWPGRARAHVCWQVWRLLGAAGFEPTLDACVRCGGPLPAAPGFAYDGGAVCAKCTPDRRPSAAAWATMCALRAAAEACPAEPGADVEVFSLLRHYAARQVDSDFRSVRVIEAMLGETKRGAGSDTQA